MDINHKSDAGLSALGYLMLVESDDSVVIPLLEMANKEGIQINESCEMGKSLFSLAAAKNVVRLDEVVNLLLDAKLSPDSDFEQYLNSVLDDKTRARVNNALLGGMLGHDEEEGCSFSL